MTTAHRRFLAIAGTLAALAHVGVGARQVGGGRAGGPPVQPVGPGQAGSAGAQQAPQILTPGQAQLLGRVVEAGTTSGVANATVTLNGPLGASTAVFTNGIPGGPRRMSTDAQGLFFFRDLPVGTYSITTTAAGYVDGQYGETRTITIRRTLDLNRTLDITESDKLLPVQIQMWRLGGISGRVLDEAGEPLVGAPVSVLARMTDWGGPVMQPAATATTDDRGLYHVEVTPGDYIVGLQTATSTVPNSIFEGFQQAMTEGDDAIRKYVNDMPVASVVAVARGTGVRVGNYSVTLRSGNALSALPPVILVNGRLMLYASSYYPSSLTTASAGLVTLHSGEERSGVDIHIQLVEARRVSGHVTGPSGPVAGLALLLIAPDPAVMRTSPATIIDTPQTSTDANGDFAFIGVAPGAYVLRAVSFSPAEPLLWATETLAVPPDSDLTDLQIAVKGGVRVSGRIVVEGSGAKTPTSEQLRNITITARPVPGSDGSIVANTLRTATEHPDDSRFATATVVPGPSMMTVSLIPPGWILKSVTSAGRNIVDRQFDLSPSGLSDVVVTITDQISTLTGMVRDEAGKPGPTAAVAVFPADKSLWRLPGMASRRVQVAAPGRDGRYTFRGLPAGDYIVAAADWPGADFSDGRVLTTLMATGSQVTIGDGESHSQDLRVVVIR